MKTPRRLTHDAPADHVRYLVRRPARGPFPSIPLTLLMILMLALPSPLGAAPTVRTQASSPPADSLLVAAPVERGLLPVPAVVPAPSQSSAERPAQATPASELDQTCKQASTVAPSAWEVLACDGFGDNVGDRWKTGISNDNFVVSSRSVIGGKYLWQQKAVQGFNSLVKDLDHDLTDFFVAVDARVRNGPLSAEYGLSFRQTDLGNYYMFSADDEGRYRLDVLINDKWTTLIDWTKSNAIKVAGTNRLAVRGEGDEFTFYINNRQVTSFTDDKLAHGLVGITTSLWDSGAEAAFEFDNFEIRAPADLAAATTPNRPAATPTPRSARGALTPTPTVSDSWGWCDDDFDIAPLDWYSTVCGSFSPRDTNWPIGPDNSSSTKLARTIVNGAYAWKIDTSQEGNVYSAWYGDSSSDTMSDVFVAVDARRTDDNDADAAYGLHFRGADSDNFYDFKVDDRTSEFKIQVLIDSHWFTLKDWTKSDVIDTGTWNRLSAMAEGNQMTFWINDEQVAQLTDDRLSSGQVGLEASVYDAGKAAVEFTNFSIWTP